MSGGMRAITIAAIAIAGASFGLTGYVIGLESARRRAAPREASVVERPDLATQIALELVELPLPAHEGEDILRWRETADAAEQVFARHGLSLADESALPALRAAGPNESVAALLDLRAELEHAAQRESSRDGSPGRGEAWTRLARALDPDPTAESAPTRDSIRAPLLARDAEAIRLVAADLAATTPPLATARLLGAALLRIGELEDALDVWEAASVEHPDDLALHVLLGWRLASAGATREGDALRHLHAARALRPASETIRARLAAVGR